jgi:hypothetical protein
MNRILNVHFTVDENIKLRNRITVMCENGGTINSQIINLDTMPKDFYDKIESALFDLNEYMKSYMLINKL